MRSETRQQRKTQGGDVIKRFITIYIVHEDPKTGAFSIASVDALRRESNKGVTYVVQGEPTKEFWFRRTITAFECVGETPSDARKRYRARQQQRLSYAQKEYDQAKRRLDAFTAWRPLRIV